MTTPQHYRKRPVAIEAVRLETGKAPEHFDNALSCSKIAGWMQTHGFNDFTVTGNKAPHSLAIQTLEGTMVAAPGDWIIRGVAGEFYPCRDDIFRATYEAITDD